MQSIEEFFAEYGSISFSEEPEHLASLYAPTFIAGGPKGTATFANDENFLAWLRQLHDYNKQVGMESMQAVSVSVNRLSLAHAIATVTWSTRFQATGDQLITFEITYLVEELAGSRKILAYISHEDQEDEMRRHGILPSN